MVEVKLDPFYYDKYKKPIPGYVAELKSIYSGLYLVWNKHLRKWTLRKREGVRDVPIGHYESEARAVLDARFRNYFANHYTPLAWKMKRKELIGLAEAERYKKIEDEIHDNVESAFYKAGVIEPKPFVKIGD